MFSTVQKLYIVIFSLLLFSGCAPVKQATVEQKNHEFIIRYPGAKKSDIFSRVLRYALANFQSYKTVVDIADPEQGIIIARGTLRDVPQLRGMLMKTDIGFAATVDIQDGNARFRYHSLTVFNRAGEELVAPDYEVIHEAAQNNFVKLTNDISKSVSGR
ncbi:MAG: DUF4468 domain-containing protein [Bacteroidota bacterium]